VLLNKEADRTLSHLSPDFYSSFTVKWSFTGCKTSNIFQKNITTFVPLVIFKIAFLSNIHWLNCFSTHSIN